MTEPPSLKIEGQSPIVWRLSLASPPERVFELLDTWLLVLKGAADFGVDLRNGSPERAWNQRYATSKRPGRAYCPSRPARKPMSRSRALFGFAATFRTVLVRPIAALHVRSRRTVA